MGDYLKNYRSNPNQNFYEKARIPEYKQGDKDTVFGMINCSAMGLAMKDLTPAQFQVWCYLAKNQPGYELAVSPADGLQWGGISKDTFQKAIRVLKEKNYLVPKEGSSNHFIFYELPKENEIIYVEKADLLNF